jgi:hypothetical protein
MEIQKHKLQSEFISRSFCSIARKIRPKKRVSTEVLTRKTRKIKVAKRGISAPPNSPEPLDIQDGRQEIQNLSSMIFEDSDELNVSCLICKDRYVSYQELRDHMLYDHHVFLCACNQMYQNCASYREHCKTCAIFQTTMQEMAAWQY